LFDRAERRDAALDRGHGRDLCAERIEAEWRDLVALEAE
jgi:hypothetical protein